MIKRTNPVSKVLVLDNDGDCCDRIKVFCDLHNLVGLKVHEDNVVSVLKSHVDLGAIFLSENYAGTRQGGISLARAIHHIRPELPIFLRRDGIDDMSLLPENDQRLFRAAYSIESIGSLVDSIDASIFSLVYPNVLVRGIAEFTQAALESQFKDIKVDVETPYIVRDQIIFGEIFTLMPLESNWCRGHMMLQAEEAPLMRLVKSERTRIAADSAYDFRNLNNVLGEVTNLIWGDFKNRYFSGAANMTYLAQVPLIVNHLHRYISFGSENPQLCFKYILTDSRGNEQLSLVLYQRFIFNLNWAPADFKENQVSVESLCESGELELF